MNWNSANPCWTRWISIHLWPAVYSGITVPVLVLLGLPLLGLYPQLGLWRTPIYTITSTALCNSVHFIPAMYLPQKLCILYKRRKPVSFPLFFFLCIHVENPINIILEKNKDSPLKEKPIHTYLFQGPMCWNVTAFLVHLLVGSNTCFPGAVKQQGNRLIFTGLFKSDPFMTSVMKKVWGQPLPFYALRRLMPWLSTGCFGFNAFWVSDLEQI